MKYFILIVFAVLLSVPLQAQIQRYTNATRDHLDGLMEEMRKEWCEVDMSTITGYSEYLRLEATAYIDVMNRYHGEKVSVCEALDWLVEFVPGLTYERDKIWIVLTREGGERWEYLVNRDDPNRVTLHFQAYGFVVDIMITGPDPIE